MLWVTSFIQREINSRNDEIEEKQSMFQERACCEGLEHQVQQLEKTLRCIDAIGLVEEAIRK